MYELTPENFKVQLNFYTTDARNENNAQLELVTINGALYGNSPRDIFKSLVFITPFKSINSFNVKRDRHIYNYLINASAGKEESFQVTVGELGKSSVNFSIKLNNIEKSIPFKFSTSGISLQAIGFLDIKDFQLAPLKEEIEKQFKEKIWDDFYIDVRAKFIKKCSDDL